MLISKIFECRHCKQPAHGYHGIDGGMYIGNKTSFVCSKHEDSEHDFVCVREFGESNLDQAEALKADAKYPTLGSSM